MLFLNMNLYFVLIQAGRSFELLAFARLISPVTEDSGNLACAERISRPIRTLQSTINDLSQDKQETVTYLQSGICELFLGRDHFIFEKSVNTLLSLYVLMQVHLKSYTHKGKLNTYLMIVWQKITKKAKEHSTKIKEKRSKKQHGVFLSRKFRIKFYSFQNNKISVSRERIPRFFPTMKTVMDIRTSGSTYQYSQPRCRVRA